MSDKRSGQSDYAVLEFGGLFGIGSDHYPIPWEMLTYDTDKGGYVVNLTKDQVSGAPRYSRDEAPEYSDEYGRTSRPHLMRRFPQPRAVRTPIRGQAPCPKIGRAHV